MAMPSLRRQGPRQPQAGVCTQRFASKSMRDGGMQPRARKRGAAQLPTIKLLWCVGRAALLPVYSLQSTLIDLVVFQYLHEFPKGESYFPVALPAGSCEATDSACSAPRSAASNRRRAASCWRGGLQGVLPGEGALRCGRNPRACCAHLFSVIRSSHARGSWRPRQQQRTAGAAAPGRRWDLRLALGWRFQIAQTPRLAQLRPRRSGAPRRLAPPCHPQCS